MKYQRFPGAAGNPAAPGFYAGKRMLPPPRAAGKINMNFLSII